MASSTSPFLPMHSSRPPQPPPLQRTTAPTQRQPPVTITIRFASVALSDLTLSLPNPHSTTVSALKRLIRTQRPEDTARRRLRLIYGGKVLADGGIVGEIVGLPRLLSSLPPPIPLPPPPPPPSRKQKQPPQPSVKTEEEEEQEEEEEDEEFKEIRQSAATAKRSRLDKGKAKATTINIDNSAQDDNATTSQIPTRNVYIHCSVGEELDDAGFAEEAISESQAIHHPSTLPAPQGFDRLLSAGFTEADIASLRSQFHGSLLSVPTSASIAPGSTASVVSPLGGGLAGAAGATGAAVSLNMLDEESRRRALALEERWIDESGNSGDVTAAATGTGLGGTAGAGAGGAGGGGTSATGLGGYEDFLVGLMWGFFWPVCVVWIFREEVMSQRKYIAVAVGVMANLFFGVLRVSA